MKTALIKQFSLALALACAMSLAFAQQATDGGETEADLAKKLSNPVANLISVPMKLDWDTGIGSADADRSTYVIQPVIPFSIGTDWNLITRTIIPYIDMESPIAGGSSESGLGDIQQSFFFSPKAPTAGGWIWGVGPIIQYRSATNSAFATEKWGGGPTAVLLKQENGWTMGLLTNHVSSFAGSDNKPDISNTFVQPFLSYTTKTYTTFGINTESTYNWKTNQWTVPINVTAAQLLKFGSQPVQFLVGAREYAQRPDGGPNWGLRFQVTFLFPK